jgi:exopolysaccharide/PEP-CTERM locus tyrosine autokinase
MSLVEQAAKKLEQLRKAGEQVAGDLAYPVPGDAAPGKDTTIDRIAKEIGRRHQSAGPPAVAHAAEPVMREALSADTAVDAGTKRREPVLKPAITKQAPEQLAPQPVVPGEETAPSKVLEIDLERLASLGILTPDATQSRLANEMRVIKRPLINNCYAKNGNGVKNANRIMITSALPGEGKSYLSTNLAMTIATERDSTVLLVEADPTRPALAQLFGLSAGRGLMDLLADSKLNVEDVLVKTSIGRLAFIPAGTPQEHATELLASEAMEKLVDNLASRYSNRILIFDSPPLLAAPEARVLARHMGQIVLVVEAGKTSHSAAQQALAAIESCPTVMTVLNKASAREEKAYYYSG